MSVLLTIWGVSAVIGGFGLSLFWDTYYTTSYPRRRPPEALKDIKSRHAAVFGAVFGPIVCVVGGLAALFGVAVLLLDSLRVFKPLFTSIVDFVEGKIK